jgi:hypothetical protein
MRFPVKTEKYTLLASSTLSKTKRAHQTTLVQKDINGTSTGHQRDINEHQRGINGTLMSINGASTGHIEGTSTGHHEASTGHQRGVP